jgi:type IV pilus assembly protein PilM
LKEIINNLLLKVRERFGRARSVIGIDVGTASVKLARMTRVNGAMTLTESVLVDITGPAGGDEEVLAGLKKALAGIDTKGAKVVAVVNCPQTCTRKIIAPHMPKKELVEAVRWEAKNAIPFSVDDALMDFEILDEVSDKGVKKLVVAVAAAPRATVGRLLSLCAKAGVELSAMIPVSLGLQNLIAVSPEKQKETVAVIEMGASITELNIYREGHLAFSRKLPVAGSDITKSMTSTLMSSQGKVQLTMEEAEKIKKEYGIPEGQATELVDGKISPGQILSLVRPCVEQLAAEIERSFNFYREESHGGKVGKIILFGGGAGLKRLVESLRHELETAVEVGDAFADINVSTRAEAGGKDVSSRLDLAVGAALNQGDKINLLPVEVKEKTRRFIENISLEVIGVGVIVSLVLVYVGARVQLYGLNKKIEALKLEQRIAAPQLDVLRADMVIGEILQDKPYWEDVFKEISHVIPPEIYLTNMKMENDVVHLEGDIHQGERGAQAVLSGFMLTLEEGIFRDVSLVTTQKKEDNPDVSEFQITCKVELAR